MHTAHRLVLVLVLVLSSAGAARAEHPTTHTEATELTTDPLQQARKGLERYDLDGTTTLAQLQALGAIAGADREPARALEARFLRAAAAADLIVIADKLERPALRQSLATVFSCEPGALLATVRSELQAAALAYYQAPAQRALQMLDHVSDQTGAAPTPAGVLHDLNVIEDVARAASGADPSASLAALGEDSCRAPAKTATCALASLDSASRRSLSALLNAKAASARVHNAASSGDPLADALAPMAVEHMGIVERAPVCLLPSFQGAAELALPADVQATPDASTLALQISASDVRVTVTSCVTLRSAAVQATDSAEPLALSESTLALPTSYRPYVQPMASLTEAIHEQAHGAKLARIIVMTQGVVHAHVLARTLLSLPAPAPGTAISLVTRSASGELRSSAVEIARTQSSAPAVHVRVRLGGYSLYVGDQYEDIPRVKTEAGFSFDRAGLEERLASTNPGAAQISFMPDVQSDEVLAALSSTAERSERVRIMIP